MADIVRAQGEQIPPSMRSRWLDLEDGTHALVVAAVPVGVVAAGGVPVALFGGDEITGAQVTISTVHHEVHEGETFQTSYKTPDASSLADDADISFLLITTDKFAHLTWEGAAGGDAEIAFYEDTQYSAAGADLPEWNMKRTSTNTASVVASLGPTIMNVGALLRNNLLPGGTGGNAPGGTARADTEWILQPNSIYMLRLINRAGNQQPASLTAQWYEEETN